MPPPLRLAAFNVENLFERARALELADPRETRALLEAHAGANAILRKPAYSAADLRRLDGFLAALGLDAGDESRFARLRQNRGGLRARRGGRLAYVATGRADWIGWVELVAGPVEAAATDNTARVVGLLGADVLAVVEAESRPALRRFSDFTLPRVGAEPYDAAMLVDGNDDRGIDVGLMTRGPGRAIRSLASHVDDRETPGGPRIFSRDLAEYEVALPGADDDAALWVLVNHFKSRRNSGPGSARESDAKRLAQARRTREVADARLASHGPYVAVVGDLNDLPDSAPLAPLLADGAWRDVSGHPNRDPSDPRIGTFGNGAPSQKIDYILLSPALWGRVAATGVERRGVWGGKNGDLFPRLPEITRPSEAASDHAAIWCDLDLP